MVNCAKEAGKHPKQILQNVTDLIWVLEYVNVAFCMFELFPNLKKQKARKNQPVWEAFGQVFFFLYVHSCVCTLLFESKSLSYLVSPTCLQASQYQILSICPGDWQEVPEFQSGWFY